MTPPRFPITPLQDATAAFGPLRMAEVPDHASLMGLDGAFYGHEWARCRYDSLDAGVDAWLGNRRRPAAIIDIGCATGARAAAFAQAGHRVTAVDCVDRSAAVAMRNAALPDGAPPIAFRQADLRDPALLTGERRFDLIHLRRVINFITLGAFAGALPSLVHGLGPDGLLVASFIALDVAGSAAMTARGAGAASQTIYGGLSAHRFADVAGLLCDHGLQIVEAFSDGHLEAGMIARR